MRSVFAFLFVTIAAIATAQQPAAQQPAARPDPLIKPEGLTKVSEHVWVIPDNSVPLVPNVGIIVGERAALVIDTGLGPRNGATVLNEAKKLAGAKRLYLATTHVHPEHDLGASAFPTSTTMIRSEDQEQEIESDGYATAERFSSQSALNAELLKDAKFRRADITFTNEYTIDLGGVRVKLLAMGFNHTRGDTAFWVESDRVLFSGDIVMSRLPNITGPAERVTHWLQSLDTLEALRPAVIVPSHGPVGDAAFFGPTRAKLQGL